MSGHRSAYKLYLEGKGNNVSSYEVLQHGDAFIELLEEFPCANRVQLCKREGELIRATDCVNKNVAGRTRKQYRDDHKVGIKQYRKDNKDKIKQYYQDNKIETSAYGKQYREDNKVKIARFQKQYRDDNKEQLDEKKKQWYEDNKEQIAVRQKQYRKDNKDKFTERNKQWYEDNKEQIAVQHKQYRETNKDKIKQYREDNKDRIKQRRCKKITCECGANITRGGITEHKKTQTHKQEMEILELAGEL